MRPAIVGIIIGGAIKSIVAGAIIGAFARKVHSVAAGVVFGLVVGGYAHVCDCATPARALSADYPAGSMVGMILGFTTQKYGAARAVAAAH